MCFDFIVLVLNANKLVGSILPSRQEPSQARPYLRLWLGFREAMGRSSGHGFQAVTWSRLLTRLIDQFRTQLNVPAIVPQLLSLSIDLDWYLLHALPLVSILWGMLGSRRIVKMIFEDGRGPCGVVVGSRRKVCLRETSVVRCGVAI